MTFVIIVIAVILYFLFRVLHAGNLSFWKIAHKDTNEFYDFIKDNDAWLIDNKDSAEELDGPFKMYVNNVGRIITIYGIVGKYESSQREYVQHFKRIKN